ncbi:unnamed protein product [Arctia plantaginis]|uniref:Uncharacterized protein n=1 Tax=Arctia plantaginis TaxID=874455 RepID=A0A8S1BK20_ARCPL|nr:unnamed protein product [Arctia plantaginis]
MDGVFKREELLKCTRTGRPPSAQGKLRQSEKVEPLDRVARNAVIDFSLDYATNQGWVVPTKGQLKSAMSQWIGEFKRAEKKNRNRQT